MANLGSGRLESKLHDARFYVYGVELIDTKGARTPVALTQNIWQYADLALFCCKDARGRFDAIFFADVIGLYGDFRDGWGAYVREGRQIPSDDPSALGHLSKGRVARNIVTNALANGARNFGFDDLTEHGERYRWTEEHAAHHSNHHWPHDALGGRTWEASLHILGQGDSFSSHLC